tara:strand:- start:13054 stop:14523 length:1470 start_codon:yes stop_codon:yes gene_type:complete
MKKLSDIREEVANITVDPRNRIKKSADQNKHALAIAKNAKRMGLKSAMMGKHVRVSGNKKAVNDFLRITIGKSSYGDPTEKDMTTPQIDKMLNKGLKEKSYGAGEEGTDELKKKYKKDTPMESLEENAIPKIKQIVAKKQAMKIDGVMVDMFTASAISQIYDKVNDANKKKMEKMKVTQLANAAMKLMRRNSVSEGLWDNIRAKRARGERMRKKGEKGAPTQDQIKRAQGEDVEEGKMKDVAMDAELMGLYTKAMKTMPGSPAQKKIINQINQRRKSLGLREGKADNKKAQIEKIKFMRKVKATTRGQKIAIGDLLAMTSPKVLEGMFKRNPRGFMTMLQKMNPKRDKLTKADYIVDGQFVTSLGNLLTKDQTKELKENNKDKAFRDFRRAGGGRKRGVDPADQDMKATDDDRKAASKNIIMQLRRVSDLPRGGKVEFENGKTINVTKKDAVKIGQFFDRLRKPQDKAKFQAMIYKSPADMKKVLSKLR